MHALGTGEPNVYAYVSGQALKAIDPRGLNAKNSNVSEAPSEMNAWGQLGQGAPTPQPSQAKPPPAPQPTLAQLMQGVEAYADKAVQQLQHSGQALMPGVQTGAELASKLDAAQAAHAAAQRGDVGGMLSNGFQLTPAGQFAGGVKGLGERIGTAAFGVESAWKAGDVAGAVRHGMDFKRGAEEAGVMVAGMVAGRPGRAHTSAHYSVVFRGKLKPGSLLRRDGNHFRQMNKQLYTLSLDADFAAVLDAVDPGIRRHIQPGPRGGFSPEAPPNFSWHHAPEKGFLELVPYSQHTAPGKVQHSLHPNGKGGRLLWGGGAARR